MSHDEIEQLVGELLSLTERRAEDVLRHLRHKLTRGQMRRLMVRWQEEYWRDFYDRMLPDEFLSSGQDNKQGKEAGGEPCHGTQATEAASGAESGRTILSQVRI